MLYSKEDIRELCLDADRFLINDNRYNNRTTLEDLQNRLRRKAKFKDIDLQSKCEGDNSLGDLLLKNADENDDLRVREFFLENGFKLLEQEQVTAAENKEKEEQNTPNVEESRAESNEVGSSNSKDTQFITSYSSDSIRNLYLDIDEIIKREPQISLKKLSQELNIKIDLKQKFHNGYVLGDLLLELAIEKSNSGFIKFLFKNELKIFSIISQQEEVCHISKTRNGLPLLIYAIRFSNPEILDLLLQNVNAEQSKLRPESKLYELCQQSKNNALDKAMGIDNEALVTLLISAMIEEKQEISNIEEIKAGSGSNSNVTSKSTAASTQRTNSTTISNSGRKISNFTNVQPSKLSEKETKYKESKGSFYTSLRSDIVGVVVTGLFIAAAVMVPSLAGALVCSVLAALVAIATGLHIVNSTLPSYREMKENKVKLVNPIAQTL